MDVHQNTEIIPSGRLMTVERLPGPAIARRLGRLASMDAKPEIARYQRERPGEMIHLDIKKLGQINGVGHHIIGDRCGQKRGVGWGFLHVAIDDASKLAYAEVLPDERQGSAVAFLERALA